MLTLSCEDNTNQFKSLSFALQTANYKLSLNKQEPNSSSIYHGEFDPGSGRTLAACLTHASRTRRDEKLASYQFEWQTGE